MNPFNNLKYLSNNHKLRSLNENKSKKSHTDSRFFNNLGFYLPYSLDNPEMGNEYIDELGFMVKNVDRNGTSINNMFKWTNILNNKIMNLMLIYIHLLAMPLYPFINRSEINDFDSILINLLLESNVTKDQILDYNDSTIQILYVDEDIIDFCIDYDYKNLYSLNINSKKIYLYTRSKKKISDDGFLYIDIDSNDNLSNNYSLNSSYLNKKFTFKLIPIILTNDFIYYKGLNQYILKSVDKLVSLDSLNINIYDASFKPLTNQFINNKLYNDKYVCNCDADKSNILTSKPSCYCNYLRHPLNNNNQIDIAIKFAQVKNELITQIFH